jgi:hypothetical protein
VHAKLKSVDANGFGCTASLFDDERFNVWLTCSLLADHQHARLVAYYTFFGFKKVKVVGENGLMDLPDQVAWGGVGTRMDADIDALLAKWSPRIFAQMKG